MHGQGRGKRRGRRGEGTGGGRGEFVFKKSRGREGVSDRKSVTDIQSRRGTDEFTSLNIYIYISCTMLSSLIETSMSNSGYSGNFVNEYLSYLLIEVCELFFFFFCTFQFYFEMKRD